RGRLDGSGRAAIEFKYVFVAATARSSPAWSGSTQSAASASGERGSLVMASVGRPWRFASSSTATTSGDAPDCEMPITAAASRFGGASYTVYREGVANATVSPFAVPKRYCR